MSRIAAGEPPDDLAMFAHYVRAFRILQHRHQATENDTVIPLAFTILTDDDKATLAENMAARRKPNPS